MTVMFKENMLQIAELLMNSFIRQVQVQTKNNGIASKCYARVFNYHVFVYCFSRKHNPLFWMKIRSCILPLILL
jgi:hypothetical protein